MRRPSAIALLLLLVPAGLCAQVPWYVSYEKALTAQEQGDWKGSLVYLKDALAVRDAPKVKARTYGLRFVNYFPYYHMGEAYYHLNDRQKALENFDACLKYGEIQQSPEDYAALRRRRDELAGGAPVAGTPDARPTAKPEPAETSAALPAAGLPWYVNYESGLAYIESGDWLNAIESLKHALAANGIPRRYARTYGMWFITYIPYYYLGVAYYNQGMWQIAVNYFETSERLGEVKELESENANLTSLLAEARRKSTDARRLPVSEELKGAVNRQIADAVTLFNQAEYDRSAEMFRAVLKIDPYNSVARNYLTRIAGRAGGGEREAPVPADFSAGVLELLKGRHEQAIRLLKSAGPAMEGDASLHAYLGVAYCLRHRAAGKKEKEALRSAQREFRRALQIDPSYQLDRTLFSRDVLEIFQGVRPK